MNKIINSSNKYLLIIVMLVVISIVLSVTYSNFIVTSNNHKAAEMYIGSLKYSMKIDSNETNTLTVEPGVTIIDVDVNNLNPIDTYYKLLYLNNSNLEIKYFSETKDTDEVKTSYKSPNDSVTSSNTNNLKLFIRNNSTTSQNIGFTLKGGYINNTLSDISVPNGYSEITIDNSSDNTYFCKTEDLSLSYYYNGQYAYRYKAEGEFTSSGIAWHSIDGNGWGVQLNGSREDDDDPVTSKLCTYINDKPIISYRYMFCGSPAVSIDSSSFDTRNVTDMGAMFCSTKATELDVSHFDTSNVTNMYSMFYNTSATTLDVSNFDTSKVTDMFNMFSNTSATTLDLNNFDTSNVTNMNSMFESSQATTLDLSNFDTSKVTDMSGMFQDNYAKTLDLSNFDTSKVTNMSDMFYGSRATVIKGIGNFNTSKVTNMSQMFRSCQAESLYLSNFDTSNVTDMKFMFLDNCATTLDLSSFDTSNITNMSQMFSYSRATTLDLSSFDTSNVTDMDSMFSFSKVTLLDLSSFNTSKVTNMLTMFGRASNLKAIYVSTKFATNLVTSSSNMFYGCTNLVGGAGTTYDSTKVDKTYARIDGGTSNPGYFTDIADKPSTFPTDDWATIVSSVKAGNTNNYKVGDTKTIDMGSYGTHTLRVANTSTPSECSTSGFSQTACGFVLEFADIITKHKMNDTQTNKGEWPATSMRTFLNNDIYNALPTDLKNGIINTTVTSSYGSSDSANFTSTDKLYLLEAKEVFINYTGGTAKDLTRTLEYYRDLGVTTNTVSKAIKKNGSSASSWWLRTVINDNIIFLSVYGSGDIYLDETADSAIGVSPAFRIG